VTHVQDITERKLAQEQLARSNQRIADILGSIQDHFYVLDREWNFVFASQRFTSRIGKEPRDIVGHNIWQMFPKHVGTAFEEHLRAAMEAKETRRFEAGGQYTDAWYMMTVFPSPDGITVLGTEVTERKRAEEALRERDERFTTLVANLESGVALVDEHGQFVLYNASFLRIFGLSSSSDIHNVNNQDWGRWQVFGENGQLLEVDSHPVRKAALTRQPVRNQLVRVRRPSDGQELWLLVSAEPVLRPDGQLRLMICTYYDITQRRQSDETLRQREERLRLALQAGQMATWDWHVASGRVEWNDQHYRMLGYEVGGVPPSYEAWVQRIHSEDRPATEARLRRSMEEGGTYATEFRVLWPDGTERWIEARGQFECDAEGHAVRSYGVMLDLTERKGAEDELRRATAAAETANQAKDHFLAALSHELRTPLSPALMLVTAQENNPELPDPVRQDLITVRHSIELEVRIIDDLLDLSRVTSGKMRMHLQNISVQDVLRQAIGTCSADITGHNLQLCQEFAASEDLVHADPARLQQVFWNLLKNAAKFTPQGGKLGIRCRNINGGQVQVQVASLSCPCITLALTTQTPHF